VHDDTAVARRHRDGQRRGARRRPSISTRRAVDVAGSRSASRLPVATRDRAAGVLDATRRRPLLAERRGDRAAPPAGRGRRGALPATWPSIMSAPAAAERIVTRDGRWRRLSISL
jgi:hypothetical protein